MMLLLKIVVHILLIHESISQSQASEAKRCAKANKRSIGCGADGGRSLCCPGLVCHKYQRKMCVEEKYDSCSGHNKWAVECGSHFDFAAPTCCEGHYCNGKKCSKDPPSPAFQPSDAPLSHSITPPPSSQPSDATSSHSITAPPSSSDTPSFQPSYPAYCAAEDQNSKSCGAYEGKDECCHPLVCHKHQGWKCVPDQFKSCAGSGMYAEECGSKWYHNGSPECCDGLTCEDAKCVLFTPTG